jgi:hypothetical protein
LFFCREDFVAKKTRAAGSAEEVLGEQKEEMTPFSATRRVNV